MRLSCCFVIMWFVSCGVLIFYVDDIGSLVLWCMCLVIGVRNVGFYGICVVGVEKLIDMFSMLSFFCFICCVSVIDLVSVFLLWLLYLIMLRCVVSGRCLG